MHLERRHRGFAAILVGALFVLPGCPGLMQTPTTLTTSRGEEKALLGEADSFPRFVVGDAATSLCEAGVEEEEDLLIVRRGDVSRAFLVDQMAYHHVAQGELAGQPYAVMYCVVCDVAIGLVPVLDGSLLHMSAGGLSNGVMLARDDESGSYWDVTGEAVAGPLVGRRLETFPIERNNVRGALQSEPMLPLARSEQGRYGVWWSRIVTALTRDESGFMPPYFRKTLAVNDDRRGELELGLGVVIAGQARFYPAKELAQLGRTELGDVLAAIDLTLLPSGDGETWSAARPDGSRPFQVWGRWYGFSGSFRGCEIFTADGAHVGAPLPQPALADAGPEGEPAR